MSHGKNWWVVAAVAVLWFTFLGVRDLRDSDEGRYAEISREMVASGDWLTPRLNGYKYLEKPPLQYWGTALIFSAFDESNLTARLWVALIGFLGGLWTWFVGHRLFGAQQGLFAFLILMSSFLYMASGHFVTLDMTVSVFMAVAVGALALAQSRREDRSHVRRWMLLGWGALGLAVLTKGLMGVVLPGAAAFLYMLWQRDWVLLRHLHLGAGLAVFLLVTAPWFVAVSFANPEFPSFFFIHEHLQRYTTDFHRRDEPFYYLLPVLLVGALPWLVAVVRGILRSQFDWWPKETRGFDAERLLWAYAIFIVLFFSLSHSKLPPYILPAFPALAPLAGRHLADRTHFRAESATLAILGALLLLAAPVFFFLPPTLDRTPVELVSGLWPWLAGAGAILLIGAIAVSRVRSATLSVGAASISAIAMLQVVAVGSGPIERLRSNGQLAGAIQAVATPDTEIFSVGLFEPSLTFYLGRTVTLVQRQGELAFGIAQEPRDSIADLGAFRERWEATQRGVAVLRVGYSDDPSLADLGGRVIYKDPRKIAIARP